MAIEASRLISEFREIAAGAGLGGKRIVHEQQLAPHQPHKLPHGMGVVYVFSLSESWGQRCEAGSGCVLKVGKVGQNSNARFESQHSNAVSVTSTLAARLLEHPDAWSRSSPFSTLDTTRCSRAEGGRSPSGVAS